MGRRAEHAEVSGLAPLQGPRSGAGYGSLASGPSALSMTSCLAGQEGDPFVGMFALVCEQRPACRKLTKRVQ